MEVSQIENFRSRAEIGDISVINHLNDLKLDDILSVLDVLVSKNLINYIEYKTRVKIKVIKSNVEFYVNVKIKKE